MFNKTQWQRNWRREKLSKGLCIYGKCKNFVVDGRKACKDHLSEKSRIELRNRQAFQYFPPGDLMRMDHFCNLPIADLSYAAALMEGEGSFVLIMSSTNGRKPQAHLSIKMTDEEPIRWMHGIFGGRVNICPAYGTRKQTWSWKISGRPAGAISAAIYKYLKSNRRKKQASAVIRVASLCDWYKKCTADERGLKVIAKLRTFYYEWKRERA